MIRIIFQDFFIFFDSLVDFAAFGQRVALIIKSLRALTLIKGGKSFLIIPGFIKT